MDPLAGLSGDVREALGAAPDDERVLLELRLGWTGLREAEERVGARLRVFLLTWDPLEWVGDRGAGWATATGDGDSCEVVLYLLLSETLRRAEQGEETTGAVLGTFAGSVLTVGARYEQALVAGIYPQLARAGEAPNLLSEIRSLPGPSAPELTLAQGGWEPIGLGAIQDLVQEAFGPVELDRSRVRLEPEGAPTPGCPTCAGRRFGFPAELADQGPEMCALHAERAAVISQERLARAQESSPEGWEAIAHASSLLSEPTFGLSLTLLGRLDRVAERDPRVRSSAEELRADAELALALAARLRGKPDDAAAFLASERLSPDWLIELPMALSAAGLVDEAVAVGDALAELDADSSAIYASDVAVILAEAGRAELALQRAEVNVRRFPDDVWTRIHAGDVHVALADPERAEAAFREALAIAHAHEDAYDLADAEERPVGCSPASPDASRKRASQHRRRDGQSAPPTADRDSPSKSGATNPARAAAGASTSAAAVAERKRDRPMTVDPSTNRTPAGRYPFFASRLGTERREVAASLEVPLGLEHRGRWDPVEEYWGEPDEPLDPAFEAIVAAGPRGWNAMLTAAGVTPNHPSWQPEQILPPLRRYAEELGRSPAKDHLDWPPEGYPSARTVRRHFGSFTAGVRAAGLEPAGRRWSQAQVAEAIAAFRREHHRPPRPADWVKAGEGTLNAVGGHSLQALWNMGHRARSGVSPGFSRRSG